MSREFQSPCRDWWPSSSASSARYCAGLMFQSPCRDWWPSSTPSALRRSAMRRQFQSPCRDWWPSSLELSMSVFALGRFNPPVGIGGLQAHVLGYHLFPSRVVSIPLSGLVAFKLASLWRPRLVSKFQSPCRDWWPSSALDLGHPLDGLDVSIPLSGLVAFKRGVVCRWRNPGGFQSPCRDWWPSSVDKPGALLHLDWFQSPCRDWWPSSTRPLREIPFRLQVSIPLSGLVAFKRAGQPRTLRAPTGFNPPVGIGGLQAAAGARECGHCIGVSIPLSGLVAFKPP